MSIHYVQLKEASELTGKNEMTIRRLAKKPESKRYVKREDGKILISREYLYSHYPPIPTTQEDTTPTSNPSIQEREQMYREVYIQNLLAAKDETIKVLQAEVQSKDHIIAQISERSREQNIIIQSLQDKLAKQLPANTSEVSTEAASKKVKDNLAEKNSEWILYSVAIATSVALLGLVGLMIYAYITR